MVKKYACLAVALMLIAGCAAPAPRHAPAPAPVDHFQRGLAYQRQAKWDQAIQEQEQAVKEYPNNGLAQLNLGIDYLEKEGENARAAPPLRRAVALLPQDPEAHLALAAAIMPNLLKDDPDFAEALAEVFRARELDPRLFDMTMTEALQRRGFVGVEHGWLSDIDLAAINDEEASRVAAVVHSGRKDPVWDKERAFAQTLRQAVVDHLEDPEAHFRFASFLASENEPLNAIREFSAGLALAPDDEWGHRKLAELFSGSGDHAQAIRELRAASRLDPGDYSLHEDIGFQCLKAGFPNQAVAEYTLVIEREDTRLDDYYYLATAYKAVGKRAEAVQQFKRFLDQPQFHSKVGHKLMPEERKAARKALVELSPKR